MSFKRLDPEDFLVSIDSVTATAWSTNTPVLSTFFTSSTTSTNDSYYKNVYQTASTETSTAVQFAIAYGNKAGSGSANFNDSVPGVSPTRTVYGQYRNLVYGDENAQFIFGAVTSFSPPLFEMSPEWINISPPGKSLITFLCLLWVSLNPVILHFILM